MRPTQPVQRVLNTMSPYGAAGLGAHESARRTLNALERGEVPNDIGPGTVDSVLKSMEQKGGEFDDETRQEVYAFVDEMREELPDDYRRRRGYL